MRVLKILFSIIIILLTGGSHELIAQEYNDGGYNPNSVRPIHRDDILIQKRVWRRVDLDEKQNAAFVAKNREITKHIVEAAKAGVIPIYKNDSLSKRMTKEEFLEAMINPELADMFGNDDDGWGDDGWGDDGGDGWGDDSGWGDESADEVEEVSAEFGYRDIALLEIMEDMIFDKKRSRLYWDILSIRLIVPARNQSIRGVEKEIAVFKYKDLYDLFASMPDEAIWFNPQNSAEHRNLTHAFDLRLFAGRIVKIANPEDIYLEDYDIVDGNAKKAVVYQLQKEYELMEMEHELWEF